MDDWNVVKRFFPKGWRVKSRELGAFTRGKNITSPDKLIRILLIHLADGCSLRETAARAREGKLGKFTDVALMKRLRNSSEWFRWMGQELLNHKGISLSKPKWLSNYRILSVDGSVITEPGATGTSWNMHYCFDIFDFKCQEFKVTTPKTGETFENFRVASGDLFMGDRAYGRLKGMKYLKNNGGEFIVRLKNKALTLYGNNGKEFFLLKHLSLLGEGKTAEWNVFAGNKEGPQIPVRLCVIKKSKEAAEHSMKKAKQDLIKKQRHVYEETIELHKYVILLTSITDQVTSANNILELYRARWQIELAFKRLKSIIGLGHLPKKDHNSAKAWMHGKIFIALLVQAIIDEGRLFSPWGYPIGRS